MESISKKNRRGFLEQATYALSALLALALALPGIGAFLSPLRKRRAQKREAPSLRVAKLSQLTVGVPARVDVVTDVVDAWTRQTGVSLGSAWLLRKENDEVQAFSSVCPHLGCAIEFQPPAERFSCPCHASAFSLDGQVLSGPSPRPMDELRASVQDEWVYLTYIRYKQGLPSAEEA